MILRTDITEAGTFNKPHGIKGEISATLGIDADLSEVKCIVMNVEGIFVPFFISSVRPKTAETLLLTIDGIDSEHKVRAFSGQTFYLLDRDLPNDDDNNDGEDGFYASDLVRYTIVDSAIGLIGEIADYNDSTDNLLFIVTTPDGRDIYIPAADEFIDDIDMGSRTIYTSLPKGITDLNN